MAGQGDSAPPPPDLKTLHTKMKLSATQLLTNYVQVFCMLMYKWVPGRIALQLKAP